MRSITSYSVFIVSVILSCGPRSLSAQETSDQLVRQDKVKFDLTTPADRNEANVFDREVFSVESGTYAVVVKDPQGRKRMEGRYIDEQLTIPDGPFTFYYPTGVVESKGLYANGLKTGRWDRYDVDGSAKAERIYTGKTWEELVFGSEDGTTEEASREDMID